MHWFRVDISESCILGGDYHRLCRAFQQAFIKNGAPNEMALFVESLPLENQRRVFLSPGSMQYLQSLLEGYEGTPCNGPDGNVTLVYGVPEARMHLLSGLGSDDGYWLENAA